jgi:hypothetical protein
VAIDLVWQTDAADPAPEQRVRLILRRIARPAQRAPLQLISDATTRHEVDGIAVLPADGHSFLTFTVQRAVAGQETAIVYLRTTGGRLMDDTGEHAIRFLALQVRHQQVSPCLRDRAARCNRDRADRPPARERHARRRIRSGLRRLPEACDRLKNLSASPSSGGGADWRRACFAEDDPQPPPDVLRTLAAL